MGCITSGSATPCRKGAAPTLPNFECSLLFMHTPFDASFKFHVVTDMGKGLVLGVSHVFIARERVQAIPNLGVLSISAYR